MSVNRDVAVIQLVVNYFAVARKRGANSFDITVLDGENQIAGALVGFDIEAGV